MVDSRCARARAVGHVDGIRNPLERRGLRQEIGETARGRRGYFRGEREPPGFQDLLQTAAPWGDALQRCDFRGEITRAIQASSFVAAAAHGGDHYSLRIFRGRDLEHVLVQAAGSFANVQHAPLGANDHRP